MNWNISNSKDLYGIKEWGDNYFSINEEGFVTVSPQQNESSQVNIYQLTEELKERGLQLPLLIRFCEILESRIKKLHNCFQKAFKENNYKGNYISAYPIKVNQQSHLVKEVLKKGQPYNLGIECGSKPELLISLAMMENPNGIILCNGFKDHQYIEMIFLAEKLGRNIFLVIDRPEEVPLILEIAKKFDNFPNIGIRTKLHTPSNSHWSETTGRGSKFGLTSSEVMECIKLLKEKNRLDNLKLLHFHIGSQIPSIQSIKNALKEGGRFYTEIKKQVPSMEYIDVGGGLAVNYGASGTNDTAINYDAQEYANDITFIIQSICDENEVDHPHIITESGRFLVSHSSVLITDVLDVHKKVKSSLSFTVSSKDSRLVLDLMDIHENVNEKNFNEYYNDLIEKKRDILQMFTYGVFKLRTKIKG